MVSNANTVTEYIDSLSDERKEPIIKLRNVILENLPSGFSEEMNYGMIGYVVPHSIYPNGYHCDPKLPLPFAGFAAQKNFISLHHLGLYADTQLQEWVKTEYPKHSKTKLDMGKGCIRFKKINELPYQFIGELISKMSVANWIEIYESNLKK